MSCDTSTHMAIAAHARLTIYSRLLGTVAICHTTDRQAFHVAVTAPVLTPCTVAAALGAPILEIRAAAAARTVFTNPAEASPALIPALTEITVAAPVSQLGIVVVVRNKVPAVNVPAPEQTDPDFSVNSRLMVCTIHPVGSFFWAPCRVGPGVLEDLHCQRTSDDQDLEIDPRRKNKLVYPSFVAFQRVCRGTDSDLDLSQ